MAHIHELIDFTVNAYLVFEGKVLLRHHEKYHIWIGVGGHIELNEDPITALFREIKEECGIEVEIKKFPTQTNRRNGHDKTELLVPDRMDIHYTNETHQHVNMVYYVKALSNVVNPSEGEQVVEFKWCSVEDLNALDMDPFIREMCVDAINKFGGN